MQRMFLRIFAIAVLTNMAAYGQSLGEIARQYREKQAAQESSGAPPKVITNKDLGEGPEGSPEAARDVPGGRSVDHDPFDHRSSEFRPPNPSHLNEGQRMGEQVGGERWRNQIQAQESRIAEMQARIDQVRASIRPGSGTAQYEGPSNRYQARQLERVAEMQQRLDEQKRRLAEMQEAARRSGMHTTVYDP